MLVAVRAEVENVDRWREGFKTHGDVFASQKISIAHLGATDDNKVIAVCETSDLNEFMKVFNAPETAEAMQHDGITGGVEVFVLDDSFKP